MAAGENIVGKVASKVSGAVKTAISDMTNWFGPLQPLQPMAPRKAVENRQRDYQVGENMVIRTRETGRASFALLRAFAENCDILRLVIETRKDQLEALDWKIVKRTAKKNQKIDDDPMVKEITTFFKRPDKVHDWGTWLKAVLEDMFVIDAATLHKTRDRVGRLYGLDLMDGTLIKVLNDGAGRVPQFPDPSYQQLLHGMTAIDYTTKEILYAPRTLRTWSVYGLSPVEQILITIETLLNRTRFNANYYVDGNMPAGLIFMDSELTSEEIEAFTDFLDTSLTGNLRDRRKLLPTPGARGKFQEIKEPPLKDEYDEWLARIVCFAFSIPPTPFVKQMNRGTGETAQETATSEGLAPIMRWVEGWISRLIEEEWGTDEYYFTFDVPEEQNLLEAAQIRKSDVEAGIIDRDEAREEIGKEPRGGAAAELGVVTANGFVPLEMSVEQAQESHDAKIDSIKNPPPVGAVPGKPGAAAGAKPKNPKLEKIAGSKKNFMSRPVMAKAKAMIARKAKTVFERTAFDVAHQLRHFPTLGKADESDDLAEKIVFELDLTSLAELAGVEGDLSSVAADAGEAMLSDVGVGRAELFNQINERANAFASERSAELVTEIDDATRDMLRTFISNGLDEKLTIPQIADRIQALDADAFDDDRALLIAETEVGNANGAGAQVGLEEAQDVGVKLKKQWLKGNNDSCQICTDNEDEGPIAVDEAFSSGDMSPLAHPNCTCDMVGIVDET